MAVCFKISTLPKKPLPQPLEDPLSKRETSMSQEYKRKSPTVNNFKSLSSVREPLLGSEPGLAPKR